MDWEVVALTVIEIVRNKLLEIVGHIGPLFFLVGGVLVFFLHGGIACNVGPARSGLGRHARCARMRAEWGAITPGARTRSAQ